MNKEKTPQKVVKETNFKIGIGKNFMIRGLRHQNYDKESAISELIDNSIDADSSKIEIQIHEKSKDNSGYISIIEDGVGMSERTLINAMDLGSVREYQPNDVGYFGIGMKTSIAYLGNSATIKTKVKGDNFYSILYWDIENDPVNCNIIKEETDDIEHSGTSIIIKTGKRHDRYKHTQTSTVIKKAGMRYHNIIKDPISSSSWLRQVEISINDKKVLPVDPMYRAVKGTQINMSDNIIWTDENGTEYPISMTAYYLGSHEKGDGVFNTNNQGIYLLMNNKYINLGGTFLGDVKVDHYFNRLRIEMVIPKEAIEYFGISMNKNRVSDVLDTDSEKADPVILKIKEVLKGFRVWALDKRKTHKSTTIQDNEEELKNNLKKKNNRINNRLITKGFSKSSKSEKNSEPKSSKNRPFGLTYDNSLVELGFYEDGRNGSFWQLSKREDNKINILYNKEHSVYINFINELSDKDSDKFDLFMYGLARAQMDSYKNYPEDIMPDMWNDVWKHVSEYTQRVLE